MSGPVMKQGERCMSQFHVASPSEKEPCWVVTTLRCYNATLQSEKPAALKAMKMKSHSSSQPVWASSSFQSFSVRQRFPSEIPCNPRAIPCGVSASWSTGSESECVHRLHSWAFEKHVSDWGRLTHGCISLVTEDFIFLCSKVQKQP